MPTFDLTYPSGTLTNVQTTELANTFTLALLKAEGFTSPSPTRLASVWVYLHEMAPDQVIVGGDLHAERQAPRYRVFVTVPEGVITRDAKTTLVKEITEALLHTQGETADLPNSLRVYVLIQEITDGNWGAAGRILTLADMGALAKQAG